MSNTSSNPTPLFRGVLVSHDGLSCFVQVAEGVTDAQAQEAWVRIVDSGQIVCGSGPVWLIPNGDRVTALRAMLDL